MSDALTIVPMTDVHVDRLMAHEQELFGTESWSPDSYRAEIADTRSRYYIAIENAAGALHGWAGLLIAGDQAEILTVGVTRAAQRRGLARRMLAALYDEAIRRGARELFLEVRVDNVAAISLYESEGFVQIAQRRGYYEHGRVDAAVMRRAL
ncbi:MAG TPA: ribosomal protein S18-alanine N-acetyltransferase [Jatrophihabitans sp.]|jgi:ribosomal-protein-alanine acetyltransferase